MRTTLHLLTAIIVFSCALTAHAQTYVFAQLQGFITMNTTGWNLNGAAAVGDTPGDIDPFNNELVLTPPVQNTNGGIFYGTPINLAMCTRWTAEFDYRVWDGTGADGLAFCFLPNPPVGFLIGSDMGLPPNAPGLKVVFDSFDNCGNMNPELQIFEGTGYGECIAGISKIDNALGNMWFLRSTNYNAARITYDNGLIQVYVNNNLMLSANFPINYVGYMGFTASTGNSTDRHSIRNVNIYTEQATSNAGPDVAFCSGGSAQIGAANNANYSYSWNDPLGGLNQTNISNPQVSLSNAGNTPVVHQYVVSTSMANNAGVCPTSDTVNVTVNPQPLADFSIADDSVCINVATGITYAGNMTGTATYNWNFGGGTVISGTGQGPYQVSWATPGTKTVTLTVSQYGCNSTVFTRTIEVLPEPVASFSAPPQLCLNETGVFAYNGTPLGGSATYTWNFDGGVIASGSNEGPYDVSWGTAGTVNVSLEVSQLGCVSPQQTQTLTIYPIPTSSFNVVPAICEGQTTTLTYTGSASAGAAYDWDFDGAQVLSGTGQGPYVLDGNAAGNFQLSLNVTENGCTSPLSTMPFEVLAAPAVNFSAVTLSGCNPLPVQFNNLTPAQPGNTFVWTASNGNSSTLENPLITFPHTGTFSITLQVTNALGCSSSFTRSNYINVIPQPVAGFNVMPLEITMADPVATISDESQNADFWSYSTGDGATYSIPSFSHNYTAPGDYIIQQTVSNTIGCTDIATVPVRVLPASSAFIPNSFTPGQNGINDRWMPVISFITNYDLTIFDRWGGVVLSSDNIYEGWNGTYYNSGDPVKGEVFSYRIRYTELTGRRKELFGHITMIR